MTRELPVGLGGGNPQADRRTKPCRLCGDEGVLFHPFPEAIDGVEVDRLCPSCWPPSVAMRAMPRLAPPSRDKPSHADAPPRLP